MPADPEFLAAFDRLPLGGYGATYDGRRWRIVKEAHCTGRSQKLMAEELGGNGHVSFNLYRLETGHAILKPFEMEPEAVRHFVLGLAAD